jgi:hypothetical protein
MTRRRLRERAMWVAWPAFLMAGVLESLVFAFVDPAQVAGQGAAAWPLSPMAVYTLAFFVFWAVSAAGSALTLLLAGGNEPPPLQ